MSLSQSGENPIELLASAIGLRALQRWEDALPVLDTLLAQAPLLFPAYLERAQVLAALKRFPSALEDLALVQRASSDFPGLVQVRALVTSAALEHYADTLQGPRVLVSTLLARASVFEILDRKQEALSDLRHAVQLDPEHVEAWNRLGGLELALHAHAKATTCYQRCIARAPLDPVLHFNLGNVLQQSGDIDAAMQSYRRATELRPDFAEAWVEIAHCHFLLGAYPQAWPLYEWRWQTAQLRDKRLATMQAAWLGNWTGTLECIVWQVATGTDLKDKTLLIWAEQGAGDTLQFLRFVPGLGERFKKIVLRVPRSLVRIAVSLDADIEVVAEDEVLPEHDMHCPLMSLPLALGVEQIPYRIDSPYLFIRSPQTSAKQSAAKLRVGVVWAGRQTGPSNAGRDMRLQDLQEMLALDVTWVDLQLPVPTEDRELHLCLHGTKRLSTPDKVFEDFADTAAVIVGLDLVISVDTAVAHLAGALDVPCWLALRASSEWRWQRDRSDTPWYPKHRIFRQREHGNWATVIADMTTALHLLMNDPEPREF